MKLSEIQRKARDLGIKDGWKFSKKQLIKHIQRKEGNFDCFGGGQSSCSEMGCCWRSDCIK